MSLIKRDFFTAPSLKPVQWDFNLGAFTTSQRVGNEWQQVPVAQPFALDFWLAQHGYEVWTDSNGKKERKTSMASVSGPMPEEPSGKTTRLYTVPVWSGELGGQRELVIKGEAITAAFADLFDEIEAKLDGVDDVPVPIVSVSSKDTVEYGKAPVFNLDDWELRPNNWPKPIVSFT
jgi:hypothetical protein